MENEKIIMNKLDSILIALTDHIRTSDERFNQVDERFDQVDERFEKVDERSDKMEGYLQALKNGQKSIRMDLQKMSQRIDDTYELALSTWGDHEETKIRLSSLEA